MLILNGRERKTLEEARHRIKDQRQRRRVDALLELSKGLPLKLVAQRIGVSEIEVTTWARRFAVDRLRKPTRKRQAETILDNWKARKARHLMPTNAELISQARQPIQSAGADLQADPADLF